MRTGAISVAAYAAALLGTASMRVRVPFGAVRTRWARWHIARKLRRFERRGRRILQLTAASRELPHHASGGSVATGFSVLPPRSVAILGEFSAGKSTLLNALLAHPVLATGLVETTELPAVLVHGEGLSIEALDGNGAATPLDAVADGVGSSQDVVPPDTVALRIALPSPLLAKFALIDTPGSNTPNASHRHVASLVAAQCRSWLFATRAEQALRKSEIDWLVAHGARERVFAVALTVSDRLKRRDQRRAAAAARGRLVEAGLHYGLVLPVSVNSPTSLGLLRHALSIVYELNQRHPALADESAQRKAIRDEWREMRAFLVSELEARVASGEVSMRAAEEAAACRWLPRVLRQAEDAYSDLRTEAASISDAWYEDLRRRIDTTFVTAAELRRPPPSDTVDRRARMILERLSRAAGANVTYAQVPTVHAVPLAKPVEALDPKQRYHVPPYVYGTPPGFGFWAAIVAIFEDQRASRRRRQAEWRGFVEAERTRYGTYIRNWLVEHERQTVAALRRLAELEAEAATEAVRAALRRGELVARQQDRLELLFSDYSEYFEESSPQ